MSFATIATVVHDPKPDLDALEFAISAARIWNAHLHVVCIGIDSTDSGFYYAGAQAIAVQQNLEEAQKNAHAIEDLVTKRLERSEIPWDTETVTVFANGIEPFLTEHMRYSDLAILPLPYGEARNHIDISAFEACLFGADIPVIVVPDNVSWEMAPERVLVAWDEGDEALASARAAMPIAANAKATEVCIVDPPAYGSDRSDPGGRLAQFLSRNGAKVEINVAARSGYDISDQLLQRATEMGAELMVMGGYGHSRLREAIVGGVTRSMLRKAHLPVLMAR